MSDVLHRLVSKALGMPNTSARLAPRPDGQLEASSPLEPDASGMEVDTEDVVAPVPASAGLMRRAANAPAPFPEVQVAAPRETSAESVPSQNPPVRTAPRFDQSQVSPRPSQLPALSMPDDHRPSFRRDELAATPVVTPQLPADASGAAVAAGVHEEAAPVVAAPALASAISGSRVVTVARPPEASTTARRALRSVDVVPRATLEMSAREETTVPSRLKEPHAAAFSSQRAEAPAVHVTIGRLEIRAPQAAAPPARVQTPRPQTLDEY